MRPMTQPSCVPRLLPDSRRFLVSFELTPPAYGVRCVGLLELASRLVRMPVPSSVPPAMTSPSSSASAKPPRQIALSASRAKDFMQCELLYRFRSVDRLPEPPSAAASRGTLVHGVLERLFDAPSSHRTLDHAVTLLKPQWQTMVRRRAELTELAESEGGLDAWFTIAEQLLATYFAIEDPSVLAPAHRELFVETRLSEGVLLRGIVDRIDVAGGGLVRVVDYKTGKSPAPRFQSEAYFQMRFYALILWRKFGTMPSRLQLEYLGDGQILRLDPTEEEIVQTENKVLALWASIEDAAKLGRWRTRKGPLCNWCAFQRYCPEYDGTPPEPPQGALNAILNSRVTA